MTTVPKIPLDLSVVTPGRLIDLLYNLREKRKVIEARANLVKEDEDKIKEHLIQRLKKNELKGLAGKIARCSLSETIKPHVKDWEALNKFIIENDAWDLRNKAPNAAAFRARWQDGIEIPGVTQFKDVRINITKLPTKE